MFADLYVFSLVGLVLNLVADLTYTLVDPRHRFRDARHDHASDVPRRRDRASSACASRR